MQAPSNRTEDNRLSLVIIITTNEKHAKLEIVMTLKKTVGSGIKYYIRISLTQSSDSVSSSETGYSSDESSNGLASFDNSDDESSCI